MSFKKSLALYIGGEGRKERRKRRRKGGQEASYGIAQLPVAGGGRFKISLILFL